MDEPEDLGHHQVEVPVCRRLQDAPGKMLAGHERAAVAGSAASRATTMDRRGRRPSAGCRHGDIVEQNSTDTSWRLAVSPGAASRGGLRHRRRAELRHSSRMSPRPPIETLGQLKAAVARGDVRRRSVRDEVRDNLTVKLRRQEPLFPGIVGYDDTVVPQLSMPSSPGTTSSCSACAVRRRRASCAP